jgi:hypothetical protein
MVVFWVVAPCSLVEVYQLHGATTQKIAIFVITAVRTSIPRTDFISGEVLLVAFFLYRKFV